VGDLIFKLKSQETRKLKGSGDVRTLHFLAGANMRIGKRFKLKGSSF
jgi:hypothetical protein